MKILSYNVNGIRAALNKDLDKWIEITDPDILCLQETKAMKEQVETSIFDQLGYKHYWFSAQKKGYSGVAILTKKTPNKITYGSGIEHMDFEGRILRVDFEKVSVISLYLPSGTNLNRLEYKFKFFENCFFFLQLISSVAYEATIWLTRYLSILTALLGYSAVTFESRCLLDDTLSF